MKFARNPSNRFESYITDLEAGEALPAQLEVFEDHSKTILSRNDSPDLCFRWSLNPYRGCIHACSYCYARPTHEYLGLGAGTDFETKIVVKKNAPALLREALQKKSWEGEVIVFSGDTDCYQPLEAKWQLTRKCLEVCFEFENPVRIITKSFLITRDIDLLSQLAAKKLLSVSITIPFLSSESARKIEPFAASIEKRLEAVEKLSKAGIRVGILVAPIIPGLNDCDIPLILKKASQAGAVTASPVLLRLPHSVKEIFFDSLRRHFPGHATKIESLIKQMRDGKLYDSRFGKRGIGSGPYWDSIQNLFSVYCLRYGLNKYTEMELLPRKRVQPIQREAKQWELF